MTSWVQAVEEARDMERKNVYGVRWRELKPGQHAIVDAGTSADLLGGRGVEVRAFLSPAAAAEAAAAVASPPFTA